MNLLCKIGIHIERFLTCDVAGGSKCPCGKKHTPPIVWPRYEEIQQEIKVNLQTITNTESIK